MLVAAAKYRFGIQNFEEISFTVLFFEEFDEAFSILLYS
jgi:hypothetical protein